MKKILVVCPIIPYPENGAEQLDRANGIRQLIRLGYEVRVIAKRRPYQRDIDIEAFSKSVGGVIVKTVLYKYTLSGKSLLNKISIILKRLRKLSYLDGAAFEYSDPEIQNLVDKEIKEWKPDALWFEYTYLWSLYHLAEKNNIPIITRSINYEPNHFLDEDGRTILNYIKSVPKFLSERKVVKSSDLVCSITPLEEKIYIKLGAKNTITLPLRGLPGLPEHIFRVNDGKVNLFFMGSTYNVSHNKNAALFIIDSIAPALASISPKFNIYITGSKLRSDIETRLPSNVIYKGFVKDLDVFLNGMDIAIVPSLFGAGMQQKIFEPLMRGFPTITSNRGIAEYPFVDGVDFLNADTVDEYISCIKKLSSDYESSVRIGKAAREKSLEIFNQSATDEKLSQALRKIV